MTEDCV